MCIRDSNNSGPEQDENNSLASEASNSDNEADKEKNHSESESNDRSFNSNRRNRNNVNQSKSIEGEDNPSSDRVSKEAAEYLS